MADENKNDIEISPAENPSSEATPEAAAEATPKPGEAPADATTPANDEDTLPTMDEELLNPLDQKEQAKAYESDVLKTVVDTETSEGPEQILEAAPEVDTSLLEDLEPTKSITLMVLKTIFAILMSFSLASIIFFTSQLTTHLDFAIDSFGMKNVSAQLTATNNEVLNLQTSLNFYRYLQYKFFLDQFSYYGDSYIQYYEIANSQTASSSEKKDAVGEMADLREKIREAFMFCSEFASAEFAVPLIDPTIEDLNEIFESELKSRFGDRVREFDNLQESGEDSAKAEQKNYLQALNLVGNNPLDQLLIGTDFDALTEQELYVFIKTVNSLILNDLSIIQDIKNGRVRWADVMNEIELRTIAVDRNYTDDFYDQIGGIQYTSYDLDNENQQITIVGETKRFDTSNFTMIANLIDSLNSSDMFGNSEMRSFSKSGSLDSGYTASLRLTLDLNQEIVTEISQQLFEISGVESAAEESAEESADDVIEEVDEEAPLDEVEEAVEDAEETAEVLEEVADSFEDEAAAAEELLTDTVTN